MDLYDVSCTRCGWKSPLPVDDTVKRRIEGRSCRECKAKDGVRVPFKIVKHVAVGAFTHYLPGKM